MYNNDYEYIMEQCDTVQYMIENTLDFMDETSPLSTAHLAIARVTTLLNHANDINRFIQIQNKVSMAIQRLDEFIRHNALDITYQQPEFFDTTVNIMSILRDINNDLNTEITYRSGEYNYTEAVSNDHPIFTYKNDVEILDDI